jgi:catalase
VGTDAVDALCLDGHTLEFVKDQYRHCKTILALGDSSRILSKAGIPLTLPSGDADPGLLIEGQGANDTNAHSFIAAIGRHRHVERDRDPPLI